jgi:hypothetical protein
MFTPGSLQNTPVGVSITSPGAGRYGSGALSVGATALGMPSGDYHQLPFFSAANLAVSESMSSVAFPNALTQAFSIRSFRDHKDILRKSTTMPMETLSALFPPDLVKSASHIGLGLSFSAQGQLDQLSIQGLLNNIAATVIQSVWRKYVARVLVDNIRRSKLSSIKQMHNDNLFELHVLTSQAAVRRYLAARRTSMMRSMATSQKAAQRYHVNPPHHEEYEPSSFEIPIGSIGDDDLPPGSKFDADGNRVGGEHADGDFAMEMAAVVIQRQVKKHVAERMARVRRELSKRRLSELGYDAEDEVKLVRAFSRKYSAAEGVLAFSRLYTDKSSKASGPVPPSIQLINRTLSRAGLKSGRLPSPPSQGSALAAVYWDAGGLLLNPRTAFQLWGLRALHDVTMTRRRDDHDFFPRLPLTIWVQGPLESEEEKRRRSARSRAANDHMFMSSPSGRTVPISRTITPQSGRRGLTRSALRRLSPLGLTKSPRAAPMISPRHELSSSLNSSGAMRPLFPVPPSPRRNV